MGRYREVQTEKQYKSYQARIWWILWGVALTVLLYTLWHHLRETDLVLNGQCIVAEYYNYGGREYARYRTEDNQLHSYNLTGLAPVHDGDTIKLYYKTYIGAAEPRSNPKQWIWSYVVCGLALVLISLKLRKIYTTPYEIYDIREMDD